MRGASCAIILPASPAIALIGGSTLPTAAYSAHRIDASSAPTTTPPAASPASLPTSSSRAPAWTTAETVSWVRTRNATTATYGPMTAATSPV